MIRRSSIDFHYYNKNLYLDGFNEVMHRQLYYAKLNDIVICNLIESGKLSLDDYDKEVQKVQTELELKEDN